MTERCSNSKSYFWRDPLFEKNTGESRNSCSVRDRGVSAEGMVKKCANPFRPGTNTKCSQIGCAVISIALTLGHHRAWLLGLPAQSLRETSKQGRKIGFVVNAKIQKQVFGTPHSWKGMLCTFDSDINKRCVLLYTKIIFGYGTKSYVLVQQFSSLQKNQVLFTFHGWCSYNFRQTGLYVPGTDFWGLKIWAKSRPGNFWFPDREIRIFLVQMIKWSKNPEIKVNIHPQA